MIRTSHTIPSPSSGDTEQVHVGMLDDSQELVSMAEGVINFPPNKRADCSSMVGSYEFTGTYSLPYAIELAKEGWEEGRTHVTEELEQISTPELLGHTVMPEAFFAVDGEEPDVGRFLDGEPESMINYAFPETPQGHLIEIVVNCSQEARVPARDIIRRGAAIVAAMQRLQTDGYSVGLTVGDSTRRGRTQIEYYVPVLSAGQYTDIDALSFALIHPSYLRRLMFAVAEHESDDIRNKMGFYVGGGYGQPAPLHHLPPAEHPQVIIESAEGLKGGARAAQGILDKIVKKVLTQDGQ